MIIQECENPKESNDQNYLLWANNYVWTGDNKNKGLGIFAKSHIKLQELQWSNQYKDHFVKYFLPCKINDTFNLLDVWTHRNNSPNFPYIGQLWKYLQINKDKLFNTMIIGDFNSNSNWDQWDRWWNHTDVVNELKECNLESFYHNFFDELQDKESIPTLYHQRNIAKPYHIDYIFGTTEMLNKLTKLKVGDFSEWIDLSDHMPVICKIEE